MSLLNLNENLEKILEMRKYGKSCRIANVNCPDYL